MSVQIFSRQQFEDALPEGHWLYSGFDAGEHTYQIKITDDIFITIRSSVGQSGYSADTGEDSIRCWLVDGNGKPLGSKVSKYITRVPGWEKRLLETLRGLWEMARLSGYCPHCQTVRGVYKVKKGKNTGKLFARCNKCDTFEWLGKE